MVVEVGVGQRTSLPGLAGAAVRAALAASTPARLIKSAEERASARGPSSTRAPASTFQSLST
jgi:hypothetical protein